MRLKLEQLALIKRVVTDHFGQDARVWLFGSRVDDSKRGGDVDLYVETQSSDETFDQRIRCRAELVEVLPYPVDLVVNDGRKDLPVYRIARNEGIAL